jgi:hypothetical protein
VQTCKTRKAVVAIAKISSAEHLANITPPEGRNGFAIGRKEDRNGDGQDLHRNRFRKAPTVKGGGGGSLGGMDLPCGEFVADKEGR